jgi:hypothetical protein
MRSKALETLTKPSFTVVLFRRKGVLSEPLKEARNQVKNIELLPIDCGKFAGFPEYTESNVVFD